MPHSIAFVDNTPTDARPYSLAHYNLIRAIRDFCCGYGVVGTLGGTRTGTGTLTQIEALPPAVTETWTLTATSATNFTVSGSVSGAQAAATVGTPYSISKLAFLLTAGGTAFVAGDTFTIPVTQGAASAAGIAYELLRYTTVDAEASGHELIMKAPGLTGTEEIFLGVRSYHSIASDYYNLQGGVFTGYVSGNSFSAQPGAFLVSTPAHNNRIDYWLSMNGQRFTLCNKLNVTVYEHLYLGKFLPYSRPSQYPYPVVCGGMAAGMALARFSTEASFDFYVRGGGNARLGMRTPGGWINAYTWPWGTAYITGGSTSRTDLQARDTETEYPLLRVELHDNTANLYGQLDGIFHISGFSNNEENTLTIAGEDYVVLPSGGRTSHVDYLAMRLDA